MICAGCQGETHSGTYRPEKQEDGALKIVGPYCRDCARPSVDPVAPVWFFKDGAVPTPGRDVPRTVGGYYTGGEREGVRFV